MPDIQHVVSDTVNRAAITVDSVIGVVTLELSTELPMLLTNRLMAAFPTPLRYRPKQGSGFVLYSVNADGIDNGGDPEPVDDSSRIMWSGRDAVWPEPATAQEIRDFYLQGCK